MTKKNQCPVHVFRLLRGDDFRPEYKRVGELRSVADVPLLLLTATCTEKMQKDIFSALGLGMDEIHQVTLLPDRYCLFSLQYNETGTCRYIIYTFIYL